MSLDGQIASLAEGTHPGRPGGESGERGLTSSSHEPVGGRGLWNAYAESLITPEKYESDEGKGFWGGVADFGKGLADNALPTIGGIIGGPKGYLAGEALDTAIDSRALQSKLNAFPGGPDISYGQALSQEGGERIASGITSTVTSGLAGPVMGDIAGGLTGDPVKQAVAAGIGTSVASDVAGDFAEAQVERGGPLGADNIAGLGIEQTTLGDSGAQVAEAGPSALGARESVASATPSSPGGASLIGSVGIASGGGGGGTSAPTPPLPPIDGGQPTQTPPAPPPRSMGFGRMGDYASYARSVFSQV